MSTTDLERELARTRGEDVPGSNAVPLSVEEALAFRDGGNVPDDLGRTLRLVLRIESNEDLVSLDTKRLAFEPDYHDQPVWRKTGSKPVNVVPLRNRDVAAGSTVAWWEEPAMAALEAEWQRTGRVAGLKVPAPYRSFVYKTVVALQGAGKTVSVETVVSSMSRWLAPPQVEEIRSALERAQA